MASPSPEARRLADLAAADPNRALRETARVDEHASREMLGWMQAARAEAYDNLSFPEQARRVAGLAMERYADPHSPLYVELLTRYAMNGYREKQIDEATLRMIAARRFHRPGAAADICLQIALGNVQSMRGIADGAGNLVAAYRRSTKPGLDHQHVMAADKLSRVMGLAGDYRQAISLIEEVATWHRRNRMDYSLAADYYFRGRVLADRGDPKAAIADFTRSRVLGARFSDPVGFAFIDLQTCNALIELRLLTRAAGLCQRADAVFSRYRDDARGQSQLLLARIAFERGRPVEALTRLNRLLASENIQSASVKKLNAYKLRAQVNKALGRHQPAYDDLATYLSLTEERQRGEREKQTAVLRASFEADREAMRNQELRHSLAFAREREKEKDKRYAIFALATSLALGSLVVIVGMGIIHRKRLAVVANTDALTGLFNRRHVIARSGLLIESHDRREDQLTLAIIDIDHFKSINDVHGHHVGDQVLKEFGAHARSLLRANNLLARWGGEEFLILFPQTTMNEALGALSRLRTSIPIARTPEGQSVSYTFSAGVASLGRGDTFDVLVQRADQALYSAKRDGRDRVCRAAPEQRPGLELVRTVNAR